MPTSGHILRELEKEESWAKVGREVGWRKQREVGVTLERKSKTHLAFTLTGVGVTLVGTGLIMVSIPHKPRIYCLHDCFRWFSSFFTGLQPSVEQHSTDF